jgi:hypothetical protein
MLHDIAASPISTPYWSINLKLRGGWIGFEGLFEGLHPAKNP